MSKRILLVLLILFLCLPTKPVLAQGEQPPKPVYVVQSGDTLTSIALQFGVNPTDILNANNLPDGNQLYIGQNLFIPGLEGVSGILDTMPVAFGETLWSISQKYKTPVEILQKLNHITVPSELFAGYSLVIPLTETEPQTQFSQLALGQTNLEMSAALGLNPWLLALENDQSSPALTLPGSNLYHLFTPEATQTTAISPEIESISISPLPVIQGNTVVLRIKTKSPVHFEGTFVDHKLAFIPMENNEVAALQGIYAMKDPGLYPLQIKGTLENGAVIEFQQMIRIKTGVFPQDPPLIVPPETMDPAITQPENELVDNIVSTITETKYWDGTFVAPVDDPCIRSWYGDRRSYNGSDYIYFHTGLDYGVCKNLNIYAVAPGVVVYTGSLTVRGNMTVIDHGWGVYTAYLHQSEIKVSVGENVEAGQLIGLIGGTGRVNGPHLHLDVWVNGIQVDPEDWLARSYP
ncbi:MAG TPA: LysM peptidoglycan-binding domain-containing protein [Anaerolineaceae bacterium]|nr:LysM peptidoglycan-binding domain-containing protein [Anaerolineaceae bacterium]HPN50825.1 LysM peptidoglycan-binding domain-containing protein [Anaerolineaceae bacterium]